MYPYLVSNMSQIALLVCENTISITSELFVFTEKTSDAGLGCCAGAMMLSRVKVERVWCGERGRGRLWKKKRIHPLRLVAVDIPLLFSIEMIWIPCEVPIHKQLSKDNMHNTGYPTLIVFIQLIYSAEENWITKDIWIQWEGTAVPIGNSIIWWSRLQLLYK